MKRKKVSSPQFRRLRGDNRLALALAAAAFVVYLLTLAPGLTTAHHGTDGGDLITAARTLGVPHPTGYPTYTLLAWLFTHFPVGTLAYRTNLLSALCAAVAVGLLYSTARLLLPANDALEARLLAAATALTFAFSSLLWGQAVITEVYALLTLFAALILWLLVRWRQGAPDHLLWLAALALGLGLGNHLTLAFVLPAAPILLWKERQRWFRPRALLPAAGCLLVGLTIYVYLPLAASHQPAVKWGNPQTWKQFLWVVTAKQYQGFAFGLRLADTPGRLATWAALLGDQFGWWGLTIALVGGWSWRQRDRSFLNFSLAWMLLSGGYAFFYDTLDSHVYLLPAMMLLALWWGEGARQLLHLVRQSRPRWQQFALAGLVLLPLVSLAMHWQQARPDDDWQSETYISRALASVEPGSLIIVRGDEPTFALWYGVYAEGKRPDVAVVSGPLLAFIWYREQMRQMYPELVIGEPTGTEQVTIDDLVHDLIAANLESRAIYATDPKELWQEWYDFVEVGAAPIYRVLSKMMNHLSYPNSRVLHKISPPETLQRIQNGAD